MTTAPAATFAALREKYQRMLVMRREHAAGTEREPQLQMRALAQRFPGALREIDELPLSLIEERIAQLTCVIDGLQEPAPWMLWMVAYHGTLRAALRIKRMRLPHDDLPGALALLRARFVPEADEPALDAFDHALLSAVLRPPAGRLNPWLFQRIAAQHGASPQLVERALFPGRGHCD